MSNLIRIVGGSICILLGLAGLLLPILQGWFFLLLGLLLLAPYVPLFRRLLCWFEERHPMIRKHLGRAHRFLASTDKEVPPCPPKR